MEYRKMVLMKLFAGQQSRHRHKKPTFGHGGGRKKEIVTWKVTLPYVKHIANGNLLYDSENSNQDSVTTRVVGWGGRWEGSSRGKGHMYTYG